MPRFAFNEASPHNPGRSSGVHSSSASFPRRTLCQVGNGTPPVEDRNANRLANSCGPPIGHPTLAYKVVNADNTEYIMLR